MLTTSYSFPIFFRIKAKILRSQSVSLIPLHLYFFFSWLNHIGNIAVLPFPFADAISATCNALTHADSFYLSLKVISLVTSLISPSKLTTIPGQVCFLYNLILPYNFYLNIHLSYNDSFSFSLLQKLLVTWGHRLPILLVGSLLHLT